MVKSDIKIHLEIERSRIKREKAKIILDKSISLYFIFMMIAVIGFIFNYISSFMLNTFIVLGIVILIFGTVPYLITIKKEEKNIEGMICKLR